MQNLTEWLSQNANCRIINIIPVSIAVCNQKGGVGKSTFTVPLASCLYYTLRHDVHVVDCDYQSSDMRAVEQTPVGCRPERRSPPFPTVASSKMPEMEIRKARPSGDSHGLAYFHPRRSAGRYRRNRRLSATWTLPCGRYPNPRPEHLCQ